MNFSPCELYRERILSIIYYILKIILTYDVKVKNIKINIFHVIIMIVMAYS